MSTLARHAAMTPDKTAAVIAETGERLTLGELHARSARLARFMADRLPAGGVIAVLLDNSLEWFEACFAARRAGLYYVPVSTHLTTGELAYILRDAGVAMLITEPRFAPRVGAIEGDLRHGIAILDVESDDWTDIVTGGEVPPLPNRPLGLDFAYSSGTTGQPKGIRHAMAGDAELTKALTSAAWTAFFRLERTSTYLSPAPLYHAAPLRFSLRCLAGGGTVVVMRRFDAAAALAAIERFRITHSQWVPTMFGRLLALPAQIRQAHDLSSHEIALHAAAPCPVDIKRRMIEWWGPIVWEYYTGSERAGATVISPQEWLQRPGSVGRAVQGVLHILDERWQPCPTGVDGLVCFEGGPAFSYHNDPEKTAEAHTPQGWGTFGDIGHVDTDGYLYLTDRRANMIISGGVNIYPQEAENVLLEHPLVLDVAVIGVPDPDYGEQVRAVVELRDPARASPETAAALLAFCRARISHVKCPRSVDFAANLPRTDTGKLLKRLVRDQYRAAMRPAPPSAPASTGASSKS
jgi:long-chain acyl-CoA synthetase